MLLHLIMPVSLDPQYEEKISIIRKLATQHKINVEMPLIGSESPVFDLTTLVNQFRQADFIVADLSYERPSCYYELGIAETLGKDIQLIANVGTHVHQTSHKSKVYNYKNIDEYEIYFERLMSRLTGLAADAKRG
ncbi:MAG: hypothetical protein KC421_01990 [Anaerolineales bacterium]|nr:hypothetical protein [Anaerolineales bacterium]